MSSPVLGGADFGKPSCFPLGPSIEGTALIRLFRARSARICPPSASNNRWLISDGLLVVLNAVQRVHRSPVPILSGTFHDNAGPHNNAVRSTPANHAKTVP